MQPFSVPSNSSCTFNQTSGNQFIVWKKLEQGCLCQRKARKDLHNLLLFCNMYTMFTVYPECPPPPLANPFIVPCALFLFPLNVRTIQMQMTNIVYCAAPAHAVCFLFPQNSVFSISPDHDYENRFLNCSVDSLFHSVGLFITSVQCKGKIYGKEVSFSIINLQSRFIFLMQSLFRPF